MDNSEVDRPSPPQSVPDSEDESLAGQQYGSTEGEQLRDMEDFSSHQYATKSLREAVLQLSFYAVKMLLENEQVEVDEKGWDGRTALSLAIENGLYDVVQLLLGKGADPNIREDQNRTPFFWAATGSRRRRFPSDFRFCYDDMIRFLLRAGADPSLTDDKGNTPLAEAVVIGNEDFVKLVVESGPFKTNTQGDEEKTPLMRAATGGRPTCMMYLLQHPAHMGSCAWWERFLQTRSRQRKQEPGPSQFPNHFLKDAGLQKLISQLERNSVLNEVLPDGRTFLSWAVEFGDEEIVIELLHFTADPNVRDKTEHQMTPLIKALKIGNMDMVDLLKEKDKISMHILVDEANDMGEEQALELARKLLEHGYSLNKCDSKGQNPVHIACHEGRKSFVEEFLHPNYQSQNASVHERDNSGKTPLQYAIDNEDIVKLLVGYRAKLADIPTESLFKLREPKPLCVQLTSNRQAPYQTLLLISDYDEARELWSLQSGEIQLRLFQGSKIPEFRSPEIKDDPVLSRGYGEYCRFFQPKCPSQRGETQLFKLCVSLPERFPLEVAWAIRELGHELAYGYISTLSNSEVPKHHGELLRGLMTEVAREWRKMVSVMGDEINFISRTDLILPQLAKKRVDQVEQEGRSQTVLQRLQAKAGQHARLQRWFKGHITGFTHVVDIDSYLRNEQHGDQKGPLREIIQKMDQEVSSGLARIEQNIRELLQIVSAPRHLLWIHLTGG
ncbi:hypothetical protein Asppvi_000177 [Aspergillus pseudoviridinutans]|uniref:Ankyrin repeat-containing domain protein n=1 Tax=Aspergillus pseudoviridinutans TaxID=1517512 RepID=A0A9P3B1C6_9EURO|nr:uncharacterized protein Asppvi_000177 [Aspergillus pseudoviridinutans]GIJ81677.1 hypothetical protein Asppvi_000177 [Aspergillus pseudoviridinutans]